MSVFGGGGAVDPLEVAAIAYAAGFRGDALATVIAIAQAESSLNPNAMGDTTITNGTWGPSVGLMQIRSLNAQSGTGGWRDASRLTDPTFNLQAAFQISGGGSNFQPWSVYTSGSYRQYLGSAADTARQLAQYGYDVGNITVTGGGGSVGGGGGYTDFGAPAPASPEEIDAKAKQLYGYLGWFLDQPEVGPILRQAAQEGWDQARLMGALSQTQWWQTTASAQRQWESLKTSDPAEATRQLDRQTLQITQMAHQLGLVNLSPDRLRQMAEDSLQYAWSPAELNNALAAEMHYDPNAMPNGTVGTTMTEIRTLADDYFVPITDDQAFEWARQIAGGDITIDAVKTALQQQSIGRFPQLADTIKNGITPGQYFAPYKNMISQLLEKAPSEIDLLHDNRWMNVLSYNDNGTVRPMTMSEAARYARSQPDWATTDQAKQQGAQLSERLSTLFGKVA